MSLEQGKKFVQSLQNKIMRAANTAALGKVEKWEGGRADVSLYPDGDLILGVPVASMQSGDFFIRITPKKGDLVTVVFLQHEIDGPLAGKAPDTDREKDINDAVIVGVINLDSDPWPTVEEGALLIGSKKSPISFVMKANGKMEINAPGGLDINAPGGVKINGASKNESW